MGPISIAHEVCAGKKGSAPKKYILFMSGGVTRVGGEARGVLVTDL